MKVKSSLVSTYGAPMTKVNRSSRGSYVQGHFIKVTDANGEILSRNPGDLEEAPGHFPFAYEHIQEAISAAKQSFASWRRMPPSDRFAAIRNYQTVLKNRHEALATIIAAEVGKPLWEARLEVNDAIEIIEYYLGAGTLEEKQIADAGHGSRAIIRYFPRGAMVVISPAALPVSSPHSHFIPALINGNTVVLKSSRHAPLVGQLIAEMIHDSGIPAGVVNVLHGDAEVARRLVSHADVDGVLFTGSFETAQKVQKQCLSNIGKLLVLDTAGKNGIVVWEDCDYSKALHDSIYSAFVTTGQRYTSAEKILVHDKLFDRFVEDFHKLAKKCRIGYGMAEEKDVPFMGPLLSEETLENYLRYQGMAVREGCEEIMRGKPLEREKRGYYVSPSIHIVEKVDPKSMYQKDEICGPNVALYRIKDTDETGEILNQGNYGLVASVYSGSREVYLRVLEEAKVSTIHWNRPTVEINYHLPYGGINKSGNSRPMGSFAATQCTYPVGTLENTGAAGSSHLPPTLPRLEG